MHRMSHAEVVTDLGIAIHDWDSVVHVQLHHLQLFPHGTSIAQRTWKYTNKITRRHIAMMVTSTAIIPQSTVPPACLIRFFRSASRCIRCCSSHWVKDGVRLRGFECKRSSNVCSRGEDAEFMLPDRLGNDSASVSGIGDSDLFKIRNLKNSLKVKRTARHQKRSPLLALRPCRFQCLHLYEMAKIHGLMTLLFVVVRCRAPMSTKANVSGGFVGLILTERKRERT